MMDCTNAGWVWYCDVHDTHGQADMEEEAQHVAAAHEEWWALQGDEDGCFVVITSVTPEVATCRHCSQDIFRWGVGKWRHRSSDGDLVRGCRAATSNDETGWDDSIPRSWLAEPEPKVTVP